MVQDKVDAYLAKMKKASSGEIADSFQKLENFYIKKLWHQLTQEVKTLVHSPAFVSAVDLKEMYLSFISEFEHRCNPQQLVEIVLPIAKKIFTTDKNAAYEFLGKIEKTVAKDKQALVRVHTGHIAQRLEHKDANGTCVDIQKIRSMIESTQKELDGLHGVTEVHAPFYKVSAVYLKEIGDYAAYYRESLRYLGVEDANKLSASDKHYQAVLIGFAALLGENIYNFGELLSHPIVKSLEGSTEKWLVDVLYAFNSGDLDKFAVLEKQWAEWDDLKKAKDFLLNKIRLLSIMEIALARPSKDRHIGFNEIAAKAKVDVNQVEFLVMKALSRGLIAGAIDQVNSTVHVSWVQPRVLNKEQIESMADRISAWSHDVMGMEKVVCENAKEILTRA